MHHFGLHQLFQLIFAVAFIVLMCWICYKITLPLILKIITLSFDSPRFRRGTCVFLGVSFFCVGVMSLSDFVKGTGPSLSVFFPLFFLTTGIFLFLFLKGLNANDIEVRHFEDLEENDPDCLGILALELAAKEGFSDKVKALVEKGASLDVIGEDGTLLHLAVQSDDRDMILKLLKLGAAIDVLDTKGKSALDYAREMGDSKLVEFLLDYQDRERLIGK